MAISRADVGSFITELVTRNPTMGIPALEDGLFANLLIFDYLYYIFLFGKGRGKGEGKGKGKASLDEFRQVWTSFDEIGRVWTSLEEFRRVWTSFDEFQTRYDEFGRVSTRLTIKAKFGFLKQVPIAGNITYHVDGPKQNGQGTTKELVFFCCNQQSICRAPNTDNLSLQTNSLGLRPITGVMFRCTQLPALLAR